MNWLDLACLEMGAYLDTRLPLGVRRRVINSNLGTALLWLCRFIALRIVRIHGRRAPRFAGRPPSRFGVGFEIHGPQTSRPAAMRRAGIKVTLSVSSNVGARTPHPGGPRRRVLRFAVRALLNLVRNERRRWQKRRL